MAVLAVLTVVEYLIAIGIDNTPLVVATLAVIAAIKAAVIIEYFMHLSDAWAGEGEHA
jgi:heme/copper-type cytochrome/quinol oxidase subunit 4